MRVLVCLLLGILLFFTSCGSGKLTTTETKPNEAFVFGRLFLARDRTIESKDVYFDFGKGEMIRLDKNGFFCAKLPLGSNNIAYLYHKNKIKKLPKDHLTFDLDSSEYVYYLGDIRVLWTPSNKDTNPHMGLYFGLIGGLFDLAVDASRKKEYLPVEMRYNEEVIEYFEHLFPNNIKEIKELPVNIVEVDEDLE